MEGINLFEYATRNKLRWDSAKGELSVEELWGLPLDGKDGIRSLNAIGKAVNAQLKATAEEDFVNPANKGTEELTVKLEIVKHIINVRQTENTAKAKREEDRKMLAKLMEIRENKATEKLHAMSVEDLDSMIASYSNR
jgi:hypothetical protein